MRIRLSASAVDDLDKGHRFYEGQALGLGGIFTDTLLGEIEDLAVYAGVHSVFHGSHRLLSKRFPYAIYYKVKADEIKIRRILDCRRDPEQIRRSVKAG